MAAYAVIPTRGSARARQGGRAHPAATHLWRRSAPTRGGCRDPPKGFHPPVARVGRPGPHRRGGCQPRGERGLSLVDGGEEVARPARRRERRAGRDQPGGQRGARHPTPSPPDAVPARRGVMCAATAAMATWVPSAVRRQWSWTYRKSRKGLPLWAAKTASRSTHTQPRAADTSRMARATKEGTWGRAQPRSARQPRRSGEGTPARLGPWRSAHAPRPAR